MIFFDNGINLLPPEEKNELFLKQINRLVFVLSTILFVSLLCFLLILLSVKFYILGNVYLQAQIIDEQKSQADLNEIKKEVVEYNQKITNLKFFYQSQTKFSKMLETFFNIQMPSGIRLIDISSTAKGKVIETTVYGFSESRDDLILFKENIEKESNIKKPYFSPESWTKSSSINFNLSFQYENQK